MTPDEARAAITRVLGQIAPEVDLARVPPDAELQEELDIDSMDFLNFVTGILDTTGIDIPERDYPSLQTIDGCVRYLVDHAV